MNASKYLLPHVGAAEHAVSNYLKFRHVRGGAPHPAPVPGRGRVSLSPNTKYTFFPNFVCDSTSIHLFITMPPDLMQSFISEIRHPNQSWNAATKLQLWPTNLLFISQSHHFCRVYE